MGHDTSNTMKDSGKL